MQPKIILPKSIKLPVISSTKIGGKKIYYIKDNQVDVLELQLVFNAGSWFQNKKLIARFTASMLFEGTGSMGSSEISEYFDYHGAFVNAQADKDYAAVSLYTTIEKLKEVLPLLGDVVKNPTFPNDELSKLISEEKKQFLINQEKNANTAKKYFLANLFGENSKYGAYADVEDFDKITSDDLKNHYRSFYALNNCELFLSGNISDDVLSQVEKVFGNEWSNEFKTNDLTSDKSKNSIEKKIFIEKADALQSAIRIGAKTINRTHADFHKLQIANTILGGYFGSRLMKNIREDKGYTYGINSGLVSLKNAAYFTINTEVKADVTNSAINEIYKEIELLKTEIVSEKELELVRNYLIGELYRSIDGPFNLLEKWKGLIINNLNENYFNNLFETIISTTPKDINDIANKYFDKEDLHEVVVGKK